MLLCFAGAAAVREKNDNPCGKQTEEFHLADRKDGGFNLPQEKLSFSTYLGAWHQDWDNSSSDI